MKHSVNTRGIALIIFLLMGCYSFAQTDSANLIREKYLILGIDTSRIIVKDTFKTELPVKLNKPKVDLLGPILFGNKKIASQGSIVIDNHVSTLQNPYSRSALAYSRLTYQGQVSLFGLPFKSSAFLTTENNSAFRSNYFSLAFDSKAYTEGIKKRLKAQSDGIKKSCQFNSVLLDQLDGKLEKLEQEIKNKKFRLPKTDSLSKIKKPNYQFDTDTLKDYSLPDTFQNPQDTFNFEERYKELDSLKTSATHLKQQVDSLRTKFQEDSLKLSQITQLIDDPNSQLDSLMPKNKLTKLLFAVRTFEIGLTYPSYNKYSLDGLSVKGVNTELELESWLIGITAGKAMNLSASFDPNTKPDFRKNLLGAQLGRKFGNHSTVKLSSFISKDDRKIDDKEYNQVNTIDYQLNKEDITFHVLAAASDYKITRPTLTENGKAEPLSFMINKAIESEVKWNAYKGTVLTARYNYVGGIFKSIGNPFLRSNYQEKEFSWEQKWKKGIIKSKVFYRDLITNATTLSPEQNRVKGAGILINSNFKKGINFFALYSPVEQGNNHPDTAYRTMNRTNLLSGGLSYSKMSKRYLWFSQLAFTRSNISSERIDPTTTVQVSLDNTLDWDGRHSFLLNLSRFQTVPNIDTLNFYSGNLSWKKIVKQNFKIGASTKHSQFTPQSSITNFSLLADFKLLKVLTCNAIIGVDRVQNWWEIQGTKLALNSSLSIRYSW